MSLLVHARTSTLVLPLNNWVIVFKMYFYFVTLFIIKIFLYETGPIKWTFHQRYIYCWPDVLAPGHQHPKCWVCTCAFPGFHELRWRRHQMETFSALLAICAGNSQVPGEFPTQRPVTWSFDVFYDLRPNKRLSKQWWGWWFETQSCPLWRHCNDLSLLVKGFPCQFM